MGAVTYPLGHTLDELARLDLQAKLSADPELSRLAKQSSRVLELGCGAGSNWPLLRAAHPLLDYSGVDLSRPAIEQARARYASTGASFKTMNILDLTYASASFDLVFTKLVLWSMGGHWKEAVAEARRVLKPGGMFYACEPANKLITFEPPRPALTELIHAWDKRAMLNGHDASLGLKVAGELRAQGFLDVSSRPLPILAGRDSPKAMRMIIDNLRKFLLSTAAENPGAHLPRALRAQAEIAFEMAANGELAMDFMFVAWGTKPSANGKKCRA